MLSINDFNEIDLKITSLLQMRDMTNKELTKSTGVGKSWISQRLNRLSDKGYVEEEQEGRKKYYSLSDDFEDFLQILLQKKMDTSHISMASEEKLVLKSYSDSYLSEVKRINFWGYLDGRDPSNIKVNTEDLGDEATVEELLRLAGDQLFGETDSVKGPISKKYDALLEAFDSKQDKEKMIDAKDRVLELFIKNTKYGKLKAETDFNTGKESFKVKSQGIPDIYSKTSHNEVFPEVDEGDMEEFCRRLGLETRDLKKASVVVSNSTF